MLNARSLIFFRECSHTLTLSDCVIIFQLDNFVTINGERPQAHIQDSDIFSCKLPHVYFFLANVLGWVFQREGLQMSVKKFFPNYFKIQK